MQWRKANVVCLCVWYVHENSMETRQNHFIFHENINIFAHETYKAIWFDFSEINGFAICSFYYFLYENSIDWNLSLEFIFVCANRILVYFIMSRKILYSKSYSVRTYQSQSNVYSISHPFYNWDGKNQANIR